MKLQPVLLSSEIKKNMLDKAHHTLDLLCGKDDSVEQYAACVYTSTGSYYTGYNLFSSTHSLTIHAEQAAVINALLNFDAKVLAITIVSTDKSISPIPCGICRQVLYENARFSKADILILCSFEGVLEHYTLTELYPKQWPDREPRRNL
jgi:cytidine deaminase